MGKKVDRWIADDGQEFAEQRDMLLHELSLVDAKEIDLFIRDKFPRKQAEYKNLLKEWQVYQRTRQLEEVPMPQPFVSEENVAPMVGIAEYPFNLDDDDDPFANASLL